MPRYTVPAANGSYKVKPTTPCVCSHVLAVGPVTPGTATAGTVTVSARAPGAKEFEAIADGTVDLSKLSTVLFTFAVAEYKIDVSGFAGTATQLELMDSEDKMYG